MLDASWSDHRWRDAAIAVAERAHADLVALRCVAPPGGHGRPPPAVVPVYPMPIRQSRPRCEPTLTHGLRRPRLTPRPRSTRRFAAPPPRSAETRDDRGYHPAPGSTNLADLMGSKDERVRIDDVLS